jgi:hypothetical protein
VQFYKFSSKLKALKELVSKLESFHAYRYFFFVKNSDLGIECRYAKKSLELYKSENEKEALIKLLNDIRSECDILEQELRSL